LARPSRSALPSRACSRSAATLALGTVLGLASLATPAQAVEVQFEGFYRARARAFSSLSIDPDLDGAEPTRAWVQHRLWLAPRFVVSDKVAVYTEFRGLDGVTWGQAPFAERDPTQPLNSTDGTLPLVFTDDLRSPSGNLTDGLPRAVPDFSIWRAWGEIHGQAGTFRFGRMPLHWGLGVWQNDGMGLNADYGDSIDRVMWERAFNEGDIFVRAAAEVDSYGLVSTAAQDIYGGSVAMAYRSERLEIGLNTQVKRATGGQSDTGDDLAPFTLATGSISGDLEAGKLHVGAEIVGRFGGGQLGDFDQANVRAIGGVIIGEIALGKPIISVEAGAASGDADPTDSTITTFAFDRDYNLGVIMFEQPMPVFSDSSGRDLSRTLTGNGVSNAFFARAAGRYPLPQDLEAELAVLGARTFRRPDSLSDQVVYGIEVDASLRYAPDDDVDVVGTAAFMLPGSYNRNYVDSENAPDGFDGFVFGGQLLARIRF